MAGFAFNLDCASLKGDCQHDQIFRQTGAERDKIVIADKSAIVDILWPDLDRGPEFLDLLFRKLNSRHLHSIVLLNSVKARIL